MPYALYGKGRLLAIIIANVSLGIILLHMYIRKQYIYTHVNASNNIMQTYTHTPIHRGCFLITCAGRKHYIMYIGPEVNTHRYVA
jgi:hypothetical protein